MTDGSTSRITLHAGGATDVGRMRTVNEDRLLLAEGLYAVADGMGGHAAGDVAAQLAVETFQVSVGRTSDELIEAVKVANMAVIQRGERDPKTRGMGTTLCAVALVDVEPETPGGEEQRLAVVNVGDSRVYLYQGGELMQLTEDHSLVEDMVREGRLSPEEARVHPARNIVTRTLGNELDVDVDLWEVAPHTGDRYLLCSDGLFGELTDDQIAAILRRLDDPDEAARELVRLANEAGGRDNITVVLVDVVDDGGRSAAAASGAARTVTSRTPLRSPGPAEGAEGDEGDESRRGAAPPASVAAPPDATGEEAGTEAETEAAVRPRAVTWRTVVFGLAVIAVIAGGIGVTAWYARNAWFVGIDDDRVVIFKGRPGGLLWFDPVLEEDTPLTTDDVPPGRLDELRDGKEQSSLTAARRYVQNLRDEADRLGIGRNRTTTSTTAPATDTTATTTGR